jgi:hypothetical protein
MSVSEVKNKLISRIKKEKDEDFLNDLFKMLEDNSKNEVYILSTDQIKAIRAAEHEISEGKSLTDEEVQRNTSKWLGE